MIDLQSLPSPFYRVALKALVLNDQSHLLVVQTPDGLWEIPGGGWEFDEDMAQCLEREFSEELGVQNITMGDVAFVYRAKAVRGYMQMRIAVRVTLHDVNLTHGVDMQAAKFVSKEEIVDLPMAIDEAPIKDYADVIWKGGKAE
jgi:8-oxo-dGTP diphosphatase